jgi:hypothetical protein
VVRHLAVRDGRDGERLSGFVVSPAVAAKAEQPDPPGWDLADGVPTWERELVVDDLEAEPALVGAGAESQE